MTPLAQWQDGADDRNMTNFLALAVGDFDKDNRAEIAAAFKDANPFGHQLLYLTFNATATPQNWNLTHWGRQDASLKGPVGLSFGDWNNDSLRAVVGGKCAHVVDAHVTAADFVPPYWQNIQGDQSKGGSLGQAVSQEDTVERSLTYHSADTVSAYVGVSAGVSFFDLAEFSAAAKATGAQELAMSNTNTTGTGASTTVTAGQSWNAAAVVYEPAEYNCYSYQMSVDDNLIDTNNARLRFCQYQTLPNVKPTLQASELDSWDANFGDKPEYVPVLRDWASLALFRDNFAEQSSNQATAKLAVDSEIVHGSFVNGAVAQTNSEAQPWWQVDLGSVQPISKIRLWTPAASLADFYLFVSAHPFGAGDKPTDLLARPDVAAYTLADLGLGFTMTDTAPSETTLATLDGQQQPIQGRYVRVQRADTAVLALAEVQVFGTNHVDPDRYPLDICDAGTFDFYNDGACPITQNDGYFMVKLYNPNHGPAEDAYVWKKVRGHVLWDGRRNDILNGKSVTRGNANTDWSMATAQVTSKAQAQELDNSTSVGAEFEVEGGVGLKVQTGAGVERTTGVASEVVQSTSWSNEVNMSGQMQGFPTGYDGAANNWVLNCRYFFQPYTYEVTDRANLGYQHRYAALDYLVPDAGRDSDLKRTRDLAACRNGNLPGPTQTANDAAAVITNQPTAISVLANDQGNDLLITNVGQPQHGSTTYTARTITYTSAPGFSGTDAFTYTVESQAANNVGAAQNAPITGVVTVTVGAAAPAHAIYLPLAAR
ncbi:MAG: Ig-like domain-containing protein [Caldilineaceae bacterium]